MPEPKSSGSEGPSGASRTTQKVEEIQRTAYLRKRGLPSQENYQLDIVFPEMMAGRNDMRHIPNDYARSSLFTARNKTVARRALLKEKLFSYNEAVSIYFTGVELRAEDDELVWLQIIAYGQKVPLGEAFEFSVKDLVRDIDWSRNGRYYDKARDCISRLKACEVLALNSQAYGKSASMSLIQSYTATNDAEGKPLHYRVVIDPGMILLFAGNTFTSHRWISFRKLSPVGRRLADYIESHDVPLPLCVERFRGMCGSTDGKLFSWRQTVRRACAEVQEAGIAKHLTLDNDKIVCVRR